MRHAWWNGLGLLWPWRRICGSLWLEKNTWRRWAFGGLSWSIMTNGLGDLSFLFEIKSKDMLFMAMVMALKHLSSLILGLCLVMSFGSSLVTEWFTILALAMELRSAGSLTMGGGLFLTLPLLNSIRFGIWSMVFAGHWRPDSLDWKWYGKPICECC